MRKNQILCFVFVPAAERGRRAMSRPMDADSYMGTTGMYRRNMTMDRTADMVR